MIVLDDGANPIGETYTVTHSTVARSSNSGTFGGLTFRGELPRLLSPFENFSIGGIGKLIIQGGAGDDVVDLVPKETMLPGLE